jgi:hypothetical protein
MHEVFPERMAVPPTRQPFEPVEFEDRTVVGVEITDQGRREMAERRRRGTVVTRRLRRLRTDLGGWVRRMATGPPSPRSPTGGGTRPAQAHQSKEEAEQRRGAAIYYAEGALDLWAEVRSS